MIRTFFISSLFSSTRLLRFKRWAKETCYRRNHPPYTLDRRLSGPQSPSGHCQRAIHPSPRLANNCTELKPTVRKPKPNTLWTNLPLCYEGVWGSGCIDPHFIDLSISWRWVVSFTPRSLYPRGKTSPVPIVCGWVDHRASLDFMKKWKFLSQRDSNPDSSVLQPVASRYTDWAIPAPHISWTS
jgi:hypothetical protein